MKRKVLKGGSIPIFAGFRRNHAGQRAVWAQNLLPSAAVGGKGILPFRVWGENKGEKGEILGNSLAIYQN